MGGRRSLPAALHHRVRPSQRGLPGTYWAVRIPVPRYCQGAAIPPAASEPDLEFMGIRLPSCSAGSSVCG